MEKIFDQLQHLAEEVKDYVNVKIGLVKLSIAETTSKIVANTLATIISAVVFLFFLFFASMGLAFILSSWIGNMYSGFLIVAGIYLIIGLVVWYSRENLIRIPIMNAIIRQMFENNGEDRKN